MLHVVFAITGLYCGTAVLFFKWRGQYISLVSKCQVLNVGISQVDID